MPLGNGGLRWRVRGQSHKFLEFFQLRPELVDCFLDTITTTNPRHQMWPPEQEQLPAQVMRDQPPSGLAHQVSHFVFPDDVFAGIFTEVHWLRGRVLPEFGISRAGLASECVGSVRVVVLESGSHHDPD